MEIFSNINVEAGYKFFWSHSLNLYAEPKREVGFLKMQPILSIWHFLLICSQSKVTIPYDFYLVQQRIPFFFPLVTGPSVNSNSSSLPCLLSWDNQLVHLFVPLFCVYDGANIPSSCYIFFIWLVNLNLCF